MLGSWDQKDPSLPGADRKRFFIRITMSSITHSGCAKEGTAGAAWPVKALWGF